MKNLLAFSVLMLLWASANAQFTNQEMETLYKSAPETEMGFSSSNYALTNYQGDTVIPLNTSDKHLFVAQREETLYNKKNQNATWVNAYPKLNKTMRVSFNGNAVAQINPIECGRQQAPEFTLRETTIGKNSFLIISGYYDYQGAIGGLYVNGEIISQGVMVTAGVPFLPREVKKVGKKIIILFSSANRADLYAAFNPKTGKLYLPSDYQVIENTWETASKSIK